MKFLSLVLLSLVSVAALAEVKPPGTFVGSLCSFNENEKGKPTIDIVAVESVCLGEFVGFKKQILQLTLNDGTVRNYEIKMKKNTVRMGATTTPFKGVNVEDEEETIKGNYIFSSGITVFHKIELVTSSNLEFAAPMEMVFTTM